MASIEFGGEGQQERRDAVKPLYTGYFVKDTEGLVRRFPPRHQEVFAHHATIAYKPADTTGIQIGRQRTLRATGRVSDEKGDALIVEGGYTEKKQLHITLSCAKGVPANYSNELIENARQTGGIEPIEPPFDIETIEGYFDEGDEIVVTHEA